MTSPKVVLAMLYVKAREGMAARRAPIYAKCAARRLPPPECATPPTTDVLDPKMPIRAFDHSGTPLTYLTFARTRELLGHLACVRAHWDVATVCDYLAAVSTLLTSLRAPLDCGEKHSLRQLGTTLGADRVIDLSAFRGWARSCC